MWELFSITLLVEIEVVILKYRIPLHFLKSSVRRKRSPHALVSPRWAERDEAKGEWSIKIWLLTLRECSLLLQF
jgi:hypothetical protein